MKLLLKGLKYLFIFILITIIALSALYWKNDIPLEKLKEKYTNADSKFIEVNGMSVHYRVEGLANDSIPLVLLHGTGASLHTWDGWVNALKTERKIIRLDLPAYSLTGPNPTSNYSQEFYATFVNNFLTKLGVKQCIIAGNSLGGSIAWNFAVKYPEKVSKMILVDAGGYATKSKSVPIAFQVAGWPVVKNLLKYVTPRSIVQKSVESVYADKSKVTDELVDRYFELSLREGNRQAFIDRMSEFRNKGLLNEKTTTIKDLSMPTLIIWGDKDLLIPLEVAEKFHADLPNDTLVVFKNLGHTPMEEDAEKTVAVVKEFLKK
ncbi:MAG: alpha/beta hydrolase [Emticicia sp.]|nr:alpha/beta hydrolase [Emticicia sp.]